MFMNKQGFVYRGRMRWMNVRDDIGKLIRVYKLLGRINNRRHILWRESRHILKTPFYIDFLHY